MIGRNPRFLKSGRQDASFYAAMWLAIEQHDSWSGEIWNRRKDGVIYPEILSITAIRDEHNRPLHYIGIFTDITLIKQAEDAVRAANTDLEQRVRERTAELEASNRELEGLFLLGRPRPARPLARHRGLRPRHRRGLRRSSRRSRP